MSKSYLKLVFINSILNSSMLFDSNSGRIPDLREQHSLMCQSPRRVQTECKSWMNLIRIHQIVINYLIIVRRPASVWSLAWIHVKVPPQYLINVILNSYFDKFHGQQCNVKLRTRDFDSIRTSPWIWLWTGYDSRLPKCLPTGPVTTTQTLNKTSIKTSINRYYSQTSVG